MVQISREETKNLNIGIDGIREYSRAFIARWPVESGMIRAYLGGNLETFPGNATFAMNALDEIAQIDPDKLTDRQLGEIFGYRARLLEKAVKLAIEKFAPDLLKFLMLL